MDNPFRLKPNSILEFLLTRFLQWSIWCDENKVQARKKDCEVPLWYFNQCCDQHKNHSKEWDSFFNLLKAHSSQADFPDGNTFSMQSMKQFIAKYDLTIDTALLARKWDVTVKEWNKIKI